MLRFIKINNIDSFILDLFSFNSQVTVHRFYYQIFDFIWSAKSTFSKQHPFFQIVGFTIVIFLLTMSYIVAAIAGALKFQRVTFTKNKTVICTVDETSVTTRVIIYIYF